MSVLEKIHSSADVKKLNPDELDPLCGEIREFLIRTLSKTGGHLASNLGTVELTVAIHRVYDTAKDRLVFDVGHQCYTHKILTGRRERFDTLRQYGGVSGFPKPYESEDDAFIAGHASNSVSVAFGMAKARTLLHEDYSVVALIGDGALTGGLASEGLATAAASSEPMVIILNDNTMSIDPNVGGTASMLQKLRLKPGYIGFKRRYRAAVEKLPGVYRFSHNVKEWVKDRVLPDNLFSEMGFEYIGPVDGHDVHELETVIRWAKEMGKPVLVHVLTRKGKGCSFAEEHPERYHGVGAFDPETGEIVPGGTGFSDVVGGLLCDAAAKDARIMAITAAMTAGAGLDGFSARYASRFLDVGIAEGNAAALAAGMAKQGALPVFAVYSSFLQRSFDMLIHDVALQKLHVVFCVDRAGLVGGDGETHHGIFDLSYMNMVPGMTILAPADGNQLSEMLEFAKDMSGPVAIRYPRGSSEGEHLRLPRFRGSNNILSEGRDVQILAVGAMLDEAIAAAEILRENGISAGVTNVAVVKPLDTSWGSIGSRVVATVEDNALIGGFGELFNSEYKDRDYEIVNIGIPDSFIEHGDIPSLRSEYGLDANSIAEKIIEKL